MRPSPTRDPSVIAVLAATLVIGTGWRSAPNAQGSEQSPAFRATVDLVQFDAVVLDASRRPVSTLTRDDFVVRQDGAVVRLADVVFIDRAARHAARVNGRPDLAVALPRVGVGVEPLVFLVDDMVMSPGGFARVQTALRQFVAHLPPGLEVGILRTGETGRRTTTLTADPAEMARRVDGMRYLARSLRGGPSRSGADSPGYRDLERTFVDGTLGSLNSLLVNLRSLPGRKTVVVLSEGIALRVDDDGQVGQPIEARLNRLAQLAAEGGTTVHTVDVTGVQGALSGPQRLIDQMTLRDGLDNLARRMAGVYLYNANDLIEPLLRIAAVERGYYLLSYAPPDGTFVADRNAPFRKLSVTVRTPGLAVHTRAGFFGRRAVDGRP